ncbi:MAG: HD domain-containing protein [Anaerolineae bacterium]|nr:HD domain-containing protein [Anaerolineae bacterium]
MIAPEDHDLAQTLPELEALRYVIEQNDWHNDDAFQQSLRLFDWVKQLPASLLKIINLSEVALSAFLNAVVDSTSNYTNQELLGFTALIHDIGKADTLRRLPDGATRCPDHETIGARLAPVICARFDFTLAEIDFVTKLVKAHGEPYDLFKKTAALPAPQQQEQIRRFETGHTDHLRPLLLLACGDLLTSHLQTIRPEKYEAVIDYYRRWLQSVWSREEQSGAEV